MLHYLNWFWQNLFTSRVKINFDRLCPDDKTIAAHTKLFDDKSLAIHEQIVLMPLLKEEFFKNAGIIIIDEE